MNRPWVAEIEVTSGLAKRLIDNQFPDLVPAHVEAYGNGWDNTAFCVNHRYVFRFPRRIVAVACMEGEIRMLPHLREHLTLPISTPQYIGAPTDEYPYPFAGYEIVAGKTAANAALNDAQRIESAPIMATFLRRLHSFPVDTALGLGCPRDEIGRMNLAARIPRAYEFLNHLTREGIIQNQEPFLDIIEQAQKVPVDDKRVLLHGDLNFRNFLVNEEGLLCGVIDWGDVHVGHPAVDLAIVSCFFPPEGQHRFFEVYGEVSDAIWKLAKFRGLYFLCNYLSYVSDIGDRIQLEEGVQALARLTHSR